MRLFLQLSTRPVPLLPTKRTKRRLNLYLRTLCRPRNRCRGSRRFCPRRIRTIMGTRVQSCRVVRKAWARLYSPSMPQQWMSPTRIALMPSTLGAAIREAIKIRRSSLSSLRSASCSSQITKALTTKMVRRRIRSTA